MPLVTIKKPREDVVENLFIGLLHYPVLNKRGEVVATAVTNLDIHDIARLARTYGVSRFFIINPLETQKQLTNQLIEHWVSGSGAKYNAARREALSTVRWANDLDDACAMIKEITGSAPVLVGTWAKHAGEYVSCDELREKISDGASPYFIIFGTGWGMADEVKSRCAHILEPIRGIDDYNHLSVRTAAAIILDRVLGRSEKGRSYR